MTVLPSRQPTLSALAIALAFATVACASSTDRTLTSAGEVVTLRAEFNNVHVLRVGARAIIVDGGLRRTQRDVIDRIAELGIRPGQVAAVIVSHGHADHVGGVEAIARYFKSPIVAGTLERPMLTAGRNDRLCPTSGRAEDMLEEAQHERFRPLRADVWVDGTLELKERFGVQGRIVQRPGHTPGSLIMVVGDAAYVGDLLRGGILDSDAETHFFMCDLEGNRRDIRWLLSAYPQVTTFFTGHFGPVTREAVEAYLAELEAQKR